MSNKHQRSKEAVALRKAALEFWTTPYTDEQLRDPHDREGQRRWNALSRAAVAYAKLVLAGQCIPKRGES